MKKIIALSFLLLVFLSGISAKFVIEAEKNAYFHNNVGVNYLQEGFYYGAIKEFKMAIDLNPNTQATSVYYNNLGRTYVKIGYSSLAQACFERAIIQNPMDFSFYKNLVDSFASQNILNERLKFYSTSKNPFDKIIVGLIYVKLGQKAKGKRVLNEFLRTESNLIISKSVKNYLSQLRL